MNSKDSDDDETLDHMGTFLVLLAKVNATANTISLVNSSSHPLTSDSSA